MRARCLPLAAHLGVQPDASLVEVCYAAPTRSKVKVVVAPEELAKLNAHRVGGWVGRPDEAEGAGCWAQDAGA